MLQSLLKAVKTTPTDVQIWHCNPLLVVANGTDVLYGHETKVEFTPFESKTMIGHGIALVPGANGVQPQIGIISQQYIDMPADGFAFSRRQGIILMGNDADANPVTWFINGAADRFLTIPQDEQIEYDEETAKILEAELEGEPSKLQLNTFL